MRLHGQSLRYNVQSSPKTPSLTADPDFGTHIVLLIVLLVEAILGDGDRCESISEGCEVYRCKSSRMNSKQSSVPFIEPRCDPTRGCVTVPEATRSNIVPQSLTPRLCIPTTRLYAAYTASKPSQELLARRPMSIRTFLVFGGFSRHCGLARGVYTSTGEMGVSWVCVIDWGCETGCVLRGGTLRG